jgi:uncharacterized membrane protein
MYFPPTHRHLPRRNVLPLQPIRDETARREVARVVVEVEQLRRDLEIQFTRIAQMQADIDEIKRLLKRSTRRR